MSVPSPEALAELPVLASQGHMGLKLFMISEEFEAHAAGTVSYTHLGPAIRKPTVSGSMAIPAHSGVRAKL